MDLFHWSFLTQNNVDIDFAANGGVFCRSLLLVSFMGLFHGSLSLVFFDQKNLGKDFAANGVVFCRSLL